jgi:hypothetical protein
MVAFEIEIPITIPTLVRLNYSPDSNKAHSRDEAPHFKRSRIYDIPCTLMMLTRLAVGLEPLNALRCRASFAPISSAFREQKLVPPLDRQVIDPLSETKNCK